MARPMSCRIGLRSCPSSGAGSSRAKGLEVKRMKSEEGRADPALHGEHARAKRARQVRAEGRDQRAEEREDQHPEKHRAFVVAPHAGHLEEQRLGRVAVLPDVQHREVGGHVGGGQRREGERDEGEADDRRRCRRRRPAARRASEARGAARSTGRASAPAPAPAHSGRARRRRARPSLRRALAFLPDALAPSARPPPPSACSSRRAWRARCRR